MSNLLALGIPGGWEWGIVLVVGLLIFGRRLPEIARSVGKSIVEFKRGLKDVKGEIDAASKPTDPNMLPPAQQKSETVEQKPESVQSDSTPQ